jgi:16S rRNA (cytosine967-C5)-methyltransferase
MPVDIVRDSAVLTLIRVLENGAFVNVAIDRTLQRRVIPERGRRFLTQLVYGTVRNRILADHILSGLLRQPIEKLPPAIRTILRMGVFQALYCDAVPFPAMVHTSVDLAKHHGHPGTASLVNAVLKQVPQRVEDIVYPDPAADPVRFLSVRHSMPKWIVRLLSDELGPEEVEAFCRASNEQAPVTLRANLPRISAEALCEGLTKAGYDSVKATEIPEEVTVVRGLPPARAKLFQHGFCMLQDPASMLAPRLLEPQPGERVLDLCAAPGGKATHLTELTGGQAMVVAMDIHPRKIRQAAENRDRLESAGLFLVQGDGILPPFAPGTFDRVLVDAPCSALGTLRRHPDLKGRGQPGEIERLGVLQEALLRGAIRLCKNGGVVVFAVCTVTRRETLGVITPVLADEPVDLEDGPQGLDTWKISTGTYRTSPNQHGLDGFFLTRLRKRS